MAEYSQNGYTVLNSLSDCKVYRLQTTSLPLRKGNPGYLLQHFARRFHDRVEPLGRTDCHGYNRRRISGSSDWSNHASATAEDLNATKHPFGRSGTFSDREVSAIRDLLDNYDGAIKWGGDYRYTKDEMHFEIDKPGWFVNLVAQRLRRNGVVYLNRLNIGKRNIDTYMVKRELKRRGMYDGTINKYFGKSFADAYARWQRSMGYSGSAADGIPGRASLEALGFTVK